MSSAIARTAWPADQELAGAVRCALASDSKSDRFFDRPQVMKGGRKKLMDEEMDQNGGRH
jgi:hypothetical protein